MAPEKSEPFRIAEIAASPDMCFVRGTPCWSTTMIRTVRSPASAIRAATSVAAARCSSRVQPVRLDEPGRPHSEPDPAGTVTAHAFTP